MSLTSIIKDAANTVAKYAGIVAVGAGLAAYSGNISSNGDLTPNSAYAQEQVASRPVNIAEFYNSATQARGLPGLRTVAANQVNISERGFGFYGNEWNQFYQENRDGKAPQMRQILARQHGRSVAGTEFDFSIFHRYMTKNQQSVRNVSLFGDYMTWLNTRENRVYVIPIGRAVTNSMTRLW